MEPAVHAESVIQRPIEDVWERLTDWDRVGDWARPMRGQSFFGRRQAECEVGSKLIWEGRGKSHAIEVAAIDEPELLQVSTVRRLPLGTEVQFTLTYLIEDITDAVTHVVLTGYYNISGPLKILAPLIRLRFNMAAGYQPTILKELVEDEVPALQERQGTAGSPAMSEVETLILEDEAPEEPATDSVDLTPARAPRSEPRREPPREPTRRRKPMKRGEPLPATLDDWMSAVPDYVDFDRYGLTQATQNDAAKMHADSAAIEPPQNQ